MNELKQNALPLRMRRQEQRTETTSEDSVSASAKDNKAAGDIAYLALAREVRNKVQAFVGALDEDGSLECLIDCNDYSDAILASHLTRADQYIHFAACRLEAFVARLESLLRLVQPIPYELTNKKPE